MGKKGEYFVALTESILLSPAYRDLKPPARTLLIEFLLIYRPIRNGDLTITEASAQAKINSSEKVTARAFYELMEHGFIKLMVKQSWSNNKGRKFSVTFHKVNNHEATDDYLRWKGRGDNVFPEISRPNWLK